MKSVHDLAPRSMLRLDFSRREIKASGLQMSRLVLLITAFLDTFEGPATVFPTAQLCTLQLPPC